MTAKPSSLERTASLPSSRRPLNTLRMNIALNNQIGAVDEESFVKLFDDVPTVSFTSPRELEEELRKIKDLLFECGNIEWEKRVEGLKRIRSLIKVGAQEFKEFQEFLKISELYFMSCAKDLRSQVVREACVTISFISVKLGLKCVRFCETLTPLLINLIANSTKIMSSSAAVSIRFILANTRSPRLIPIIISNMSSKSKEIRKACCEYLDLILHVWTTNALEKHCTLIADAIKKGISDADPEARQHARKAFWGFSEHFNERAGSLLYSLEPSKQRMLFTDFPSVSNSSSTNSLVQADSGPQSITPQSSAHRLPPNITRRTPTSVSSSNSVENLNRTPSNIATRGRSGIPVYSSPRDATVLIAGYHSSPFRSTSAIDVGAARRARAAVTMTNGRSNLLSGDNALTRYALKRTPTTISTTGRYNNNSLTPSIPSNDRASRSRSRISQSQPSSQSTSPTGRNSLGFTTTDGQNIRPRRKSGIPLCISRETSPTRSVSSYQAMERRLSNSSYGSIISSSQSVEQQKLVPNKSLLTKKILQQSREAEAAMASALRTVNPTPPKHRYSFEDHSDESETSSVSSDRNIDCVTLALANLKSNTNDMFSQKYALNELIELIKDSTTLDWNKHFREILRVILDKANSSDISEVRELSLRVLNELLLKKPELFHDFIELTVLKILETSKDPEKEVQRAGEAAGASASAVLPANNCVKVLKSVITTGELPMNQAAIKMLSKIVEKQDKEVIESLLPEIMPPLVQAYDNPESAVRKGAVFTMVAIHGRVGDKMKPFIYGLNGSKMKLLKLYIDRAKSQSSGCSTPSSPMTLITS